MIRLIYDQTLDISAAKVKWQELPEEEMTGWIDLPDNYDRDEVECIKLAAKKIQQTSKFLVCIGVGGSYLGHRAVIEALGDYRGIKIRYTGNSLSTQALNKLLAEIGDDDFSVNVISKSGTTTEPAIAFRFFRDKLIQKYGRAEAFKRIYATTDGKNGALHDEAVKNGYTRFTVPDNIGGRFSVLTPVGLLPIAVAGVDIDELLKGASLQKNTTRTDVFQYAALRLSLFLRGHDIEILASFEPNLRYFAGWWKQLFGETEGKQNQGIFPASTVFTTDLHSLGQYMQQGRANIFETMIKFRRQPAIGGEITVPYDEENLDGLNFVAGRSLSEINAIAQEATAIAHKRHIPVVQVEMPDLSARSLGALIYFFQSACAISAKLQGVNPFDQPGVEDYKTELFRLLGKPGY